MKLRKENFYRVKKNDTLEDILSKYNTDIDSVVKNSKGLNLIEGEWIKIKSNDYQIHIVRPAEDLMQLAKQYDVSVEKIISDNSLKTDKIFIGQRLKIYKNLNDK